MDAQNLYLEEIREADESSISGGATVSSIAEAGGFAAGPNAAIFQGFTFASAFDSGGTQNPNHVAIGQSRSFASAE